VSLSLIAFLPHKKLVSVSLKANDSLDFLCELAAQNFAVDALEIELTQRGKRLQPLSKALHEVGLNPQVPVVCVINRNPITQTVFLANLIDEIFCLNRHVYPEQISKETHLFRWVWDALSAVVGDCSNDPLARTLVSLASRSKDIGLSIAVLLAGCFRFTHDSVEWTLEANRSDLNKMFARLNKLIVKTCPGQLGGLLLVLYLFEDAVSELIASVNPDYARTRESLLADQAQILLKDFHPSGVCELWSGIMVAAQPLLEINLLSDEVNLLSMAEETRSSSLQNCARLVSKFMELGMALISSQEFLVTREALQALLVAIERASLSSSPEPRDSPSLASSQDMDLASISAIFKQSALERDFIDFSGFRLCDSLPDSLAASREGSLY
jgi:hypothetical protein